MVTIKHHNELIGGKIYGRVRIFEDGRSVTSFDGHDRTGESDEIDTAIACFEHASEVLEKLGFVGRPVTIESDFADYGYAILCGEEGVEGAEA